MSFWELEYWLAGQHARNDFYTAGTITPNMTNFTMTDALRRFSSLTPNEQRETIDELQR
jgi:hypothetical protein